MNYFSWILLIGFFLTFIGISFYSYIKVSNTDDFYVGGGKIPWWLSGVSHHISGYSGAVFVGFAGLAYTNGIAIYFWWALTIAISITAGSFVIAPLWSRMRTKLGVQTPTEYIAQRYNISTQLVMALSGSLLKVFDMGAKWAAIAIILNGFTGISILNGIIIAGVITIFYTVIGGLWANVLNDFAQFIIQFFAVITMIVVVSMKLGGFSQMMHSFSQLPEGHLNPFNEPYTITYAVIFLFINFLSYNGGTWHLAIRFISAPSGSDARKSALLSAAMYLVWPAFLFIPMWLAPLIIPNIDNPEHSYIQMAQMLIPASLIGLVVAGLVANTMAMISSDANTISGVIMRDILPRMYKNIGSLDPKKYLRLARIVTFLFTLVTIILALNAHHFGGIVKLIVNWYGALLGPIAIPMIFGFVPFFRKSGSNAAMWSILAGIITFALMKIFHLGFISEAWEIGLPGLVSLIIFMIPVFVMKEEPQKVKDFFSKIA